MGTSPSKENNSRNNGRTGVGGGQVTSGYSQQSYSNTHEMHTSHGQTLKSHKKSKRRSVGSADSSSSSSSGEQSSSSSNGAGGISGAGGGTLIAHGTAGIKAPGGIPFGCCP